MSDEVNDKLKNNLGEPQVDPALETKVREAKS